MTNIAKQNEDGATDLELGAIVSDVVNVVDVKLLALNAEIGALPAGNLTVDMNVTTGAQRAPFDEKLFRVLIQVVVKMYEPSRGEKEFFLTHDATHEVQYALKDASGIEQKNLDAFGRINAVFIVWPYARELVQSTMTRMGLPAFILPSIHMGEGKFSTQITLEFEGHQATAAPAAST